MYGTLFHIEKKVLQQPFQVMEDAQLLVRYLVTLG
jgi:hypothetical protein